MRAHTTVLSIGLLAGVAYGQTPPSIIVSGTGVKPLAKAGEQFEMRYAIPVSYEDPNYAYDGDLEINPTYVKMHPNGPRLPVTLTPKGDSLVLHGDPKMPVHSALDAMPLLQSLVDDHAKAGYPGRFKLIQSGSGIVIVPTAVKNSSGILLPDQSLLETKITLPELQRTVEQTLDAICEAIQTNTGKTIGVGMSQFQSLYLVVTVGADNEPARAVLQRTLDGMHTNSASAQIPKGAWSLMYSPGLKLYVLNVRQVLVEVHTPAGGKTKRPVFR